MKNFLLSSFLIICSFVALNAQNQAVCEISGDVVEAAGVATACAGSSTGQATVSSTGCSCMFSGCTYLWSDGQTFHTAFGLETGTYQVTVTHPPDSLGNVCEVTVEVAIEEGDDMIESIEQSEISCKGANDGTVTINPSFFAGQLNYQWSTGDTTATVSGLSAGTYGVQVSNFANCLEEIIVEIAEPTLEFTLEDATSSPACGGLANGTINVSVSGSENYTVLAVDDDDEEFTDVTALLAGDYEIFIVDENGCTVSTELSIEEGDLQFDLVASAESTCAGGEIMLEAQTLQNATFLWSGGDIEGETTENLMVAPTETTTYSVYVETPEGCTATQEITVDVDAIEDQLNLLYNGDLSICEGDLTNMVVSVADAVNISWTPTTGIMGSALAVYIGPSETTTYTVTAELENGCELSESFTVTVENCGTTAETATSIDDTDIAQMIYPNPSLGVFQIETNETIKELSVFDISGKLIQTNTVNHSSYSLDLSDKTAGIYFLHLHTANGQMVQKLIKE